jgi:carbonic anhydrase
VLKTAHYFDAVAESAPRTPDGACQLLVRGNRNFAKKNGVGPLSKSTRSKPQGFGLGGSDRSAAVQSPFAALLGCADARVPPEFVFSKGANELFVVRVAGNVLGQECLGSMRYAVSQFSTTLKLLVVLAHTNCGAVTEAVDLYLEPGRYIKSATDYSVRSIEDQILVAVRAAALSLESLYGIRVAKQTGYRAALLEVAVALNAAWSAYCLRQEFRDRLPDLGVVYGVYDLASGHVRLPLSLRGQLTEDEKGLFVPPKDAAGFRQVALKICKGQLIRSLMAPARRRAS